MSALRKVLYRHACFTIRAIRRPTGWRHAGWQPVLQYERI
jgi:hypothetical protein